MSHDVVWCWNVVYYGNQCNVWLRCSHLAEAWAVTGNRVVASKSPASCRKVEELLAGPEPAAAPPLTKGIWMQTFYWAREWQFSGAFVCASGWAAMLYAVLPCVSRMAECVEYCCCVSKDGLARWEDFSTLAIVGLWINSQPISHWGYCLVRYCSFLIRCGWPLPFPYMANIYFNVNKASILTQK